ncbi:MAG: hypothetical protein L7U72_17090 [Rubripirellula sp.]|nr:hypothetical protein [Rubripirellula sp.]
MPQLNRPTAIFLSYVFVSALIGLGNFCWVNVESLQETNTGLLEYLFSSVVIAEPLCWSSPEYWIGYVLSDDLNGWEFIVIPVVGMFALVAIGAKLLVAWLISLLIESEENDSN